MSETKVVAGASIRSPLDDIKDRAPDYRGLLDEIESVFELRSIRSFSDFRTLLRSIRDAAASGMQLGWPPDTDWPWILNQARGLLCLIDEDTTARFAKAAGYGRTGQKLADITEHGLLETFLQRVDTAALSPGTDIAAPLKAILYGATKILQSRSDAKALLDEAVTAVRTMCLTSSRDTNLLAALAVSPGTPLKIDDYRRAVGTLITHQGVTEHQRRKLKRILALLDLLLTASPLPVAGSPVRAPKPRDWAATRPKSISVRVGSDALQEIGLITDSDLSSQPALPSMTELLVLSLRDTVGTPTIGEKELDLAGETPDVLVATVSSEADHDTDDEAHDDALKASLAEGNSKESRYWLQKAELVTRFAPQTILPSERKSLMRTLLDDTAHRDAALLVLLSFALGLPLDTVVELTVGANSLIGPDGYRRTIHLPENRTCADPAAASQYRPTTRQLTLPLPTAIQQRLATRIMPLPSSPRPLSEVLDIQPGNAVRAARALLKSISHRRAHRITEHHVRGALRRQILLDTQNPLIAYLLTGRPDEYPPMAIYYSCIPVAQLVRAYQDATNKLVTP